MGKYIMALDAGTTSNRCILFDGRGAICSMAQKEFRQHFPEAGWVEHDAAEIWDTMLSVIREAMEKAGASAGDIAAIGITNQRETTILWDRETGLPVSRAIVWQCRRTADFTEAFRKERPEAERTFREKTGLILDPYFSGTKIRWILDHAAGVRERAAEGKICFGTVDSWLIWNLTGGRVHATDYSNASRTLLFNIHTLRWDKELCDMLEIPMGILPEALPSSGIFGETDPALFGGPIPIAGAAGDQQAALFGQTCFSPGEAKNTYGTGCFMLMNTGETPVESEHGLLTTIAWGLGGKVNYALEGSVYVAGAVIQWLRDELRLIDRSPDSEYFAMQVEDTAGCYVVPAFTGLGAPYWDPYARGMITGLTRGVNKYHIIRAALESMAFQTTDVLEAMEGDSGIRLASLRVDGGAAMNNFLMQFQADLAGVPVERPAVVESTAMGAAFLAGLAAGFWSDTEELRKIPVIEKSFVPERDEAWRDKEQKGWRQAVLACRGWAAPRS